MSKIYIPLRDTALISILLRIQTQQKIVRTIFTFVYACPQCLKSILTVGQVPATQPHNDLYGM